MFDRGDQFANPCGLRKVLGQLVYPCGSPTRELNPIFRTLMHEPLSLPALVSKFVSFALLSNVRHHGLERDHNLTQPVLDL